MRVSLLQTVYFKIISSTINMLYTVLLLSISSFGQVGIGTISPNATLEIKSSN